MASYRRQIEFQGKSADELYEKISETIDQFLEKLNLGKINLEKNPKEKEVKFESKIANAKLTCFDEKVAIEAELSWMARAFQSKIDEGIDRWLDRALGPKSSSKNEPK